MFHTTQLHDHQRLGLRRPDSFLPLAEARGSEQVLKRDRQEADQTVMEPGLQCRGANTRNGRARSAGPRVVAAACAAPRLAAAFLFALVPLSAQVGLGLSPMRVELRLAPGASFTGALRLVNEGSAVRGRATLLDFQLDDQQTPQFEERIPNEAAYSCRDWLTLNPMEADLPANGESVVRYTLRVPPAATARSYYCAAGFTSSPPANSPNQGMGMQTAVRIVAAFYVIVGSPAVEGQLDQILLERVPNSKEMRAVVVVENSGKMYFRPNGSLTVLDQGGQVLETHELTPVPILPERRQRLLFPLKIADGQPCTIKVRLDLGTGEIQEGSAVVAGANVLR